MVWLRRRAPHALSLSGSTRNSVLLVSDDIRDRFATVGAEPLSSTPDEYAADIDRDDAKWSALMKSLA